jgi:hypothetical protein
MKLTTSPQNAVGEENRMKAVSDTENNVVYTCGSATENCGFNRKGRLVFLTDGSGTETNHTYKPDNRLWNIFSVENSIKDLH